MRKIQKKIDRRKLLSSFMTVVFLILFNTILCSLAVAVVRDLLLPLATLFSYDLHLYMEQLRYNSFYEAEEARLALAIYRACAFPTVFLGAPFAFRTGILRGRKFRETTEARITYADGMRLYMKEYGRYDMAMCVIVASVLWLIPFGVYLSPISTALYGWIPSVYGWMITVGVLLLTLPLGVFFAQKHWRAQYICAAME